GLRSNDLRDAVSSRRSPPGNESLLAETKRLACPQEPWRHVSGQIAPGEPDRSGPVTARLGKRAEQRFHQVRYVAGDRALQQKQRGVAEKRPDTGGPRQVRRRKIARTFHRQPGHAEAAGKLRRTIAKDAALLVRMMQLGQKDVFGNVQESNPAADAEDPA